MAVSVGVAPRRERLFYVGMAVAIAAIAFAGFARTYYLRWYYDSPPLMPLLHLHGLLFTSWLVLLLAQTSLVAAHRVDLHRRLGVVGAALAGLMVVVGTVTAVTRAGQGAAPPGVPPLAFFGLADLLIVACGVYDLATRGRVHCATLLGGLAIVLSQPLRLMLSGTGAWLGFAEWLTR